MSEIVIEFLGDRATLRDLKWYSESQALLNLLAVLPYEPGLYTGYAPDDNWAYVLQLTQQSSKIKILTSFPPASTEVDVVN